MTTRKTLCAIIASIGFGVSAIAFAQAPAGEHAAEHEAHTKQPAAQSPEAKRDQSAPASDSKMHMMDEHMRRMAELRNAIANASTPEKHQAAMRAQMHAMEQGMAAMKGMQDMGGVEGMGGMQNREGMSGMHGQGGMPMMRMHQMMEKRMSMMEEMMESMMQMMDMRMGGPGQGGMKMERK